MKLNRRRRKNEAVIRITAKGVTYTQIIPESVAGQVIAHVIRVIDKKGE